MNILDQLERDIDSLILNLPLDNPDEINRCACLLNRWLKFLICFRAYDEKVREIVANAVPELSDSERHHPIDALTASLSEFNANLERARANDG